MDNENYEVEQIINDALVDFSQPHLGRLYLVVWKGYPDPSSNTWEPTSGLQHLRIWKAYERAKGRSCSDQDTTKDDRDYLPPKQTKTKVHKRLKKKKKQTKTKQIKKKIFKKRKRKKKKLILTSPKHNDNDYARHSNNRHSRMRSHIQSYADTLLPSRHINNTNSDSNSEDEPIMSKQPLQSNVIPKRSSSSSLLRIPKRSGYDSMRHFNHKSKPILIQNKTVCNTNHVTSTSYPPSSNALSINTMITPSPIPCAASILPLTNTMHPVHVHRPKERVFMDLTKSSDEADIDMMEKKTQATTKVHVQEGRFTPISSDSESEDNSPPFRAIQPTIQTKCTEDIEMTTLSHKQQAPIPLQRTTNTPYSSSRASNVEDNTARYTHTIIQRNRYKHNGNTYGTFDDDHHRHNDNAYTHNTHQRTRHDTHTPYMDRYNRSNSNHNHNGRKNNNDRSPYNKQRSRSRSRDSSRRHNYRREERIGTEMHVACNERVASPPPPLPPVSLVVMDKVDRQKTKKRKGREVEYDALPLPTQRHCFANRFRVFGEDIAIYLTAKEVIEPINGINDWLDPQMIDEPITIADSITAGTNASKSCTSMSAMSVGNNDNAWCFTLCVEEEKKTDSASPGDIIAMLNCRLDGVHELSLEIKPKRMVLYQLDKKKKKLCHYVKGLQPKKDVKHMICQFAIVSPIVYRKEKEIRSFQRQLRKKDTFTFVSDQSVNGYVIGMQIVNVTTAFDGGTVVECILYPIRYKH
eukprot:1026107_1